MDKFDALSNAELRDQLKANGMNFPVTDTTRNALIKKLRNSVNGPAKPVKGRRETLSVVKHSSADDSESNDEPTKAIKPKTVNNRRATIAAAIIPPKSANITNGVSTDKVASKPIAVPSKPVVVRSKSPVRPKSPSRKSAAAEPMSYFADESDDDLIAAAAAADEVEKQSKVLRKTRTSRSPSLSKSSVVTTSYKHTIEPLVELNDDVILLNDNSDAEYSSDMLEKIKKPSTPTTKISAATDIRRKTLQVGISTNYSNITANDKPTVTEDSSSAYRRRYTTHATPPRQAQEDLNDADFMKKIETPFLSDFTRRLASLKAEPLPGNESSFDYRTPKHTTTAAAYTTDYRSSIYGSGRVGDRFRDTNLLLKQQQQQQQQQKQASAWSKLEEKVRWPLLILFILFVAIAVYVFLFSNY